METGLTGLQTALQFPPPWLFIIIAAGLTWWLTRKRGVTLLTLFGLALVWNMELWAATTSTIALVIISHAGGHHHRACPWASWRPCTSPWTRP